MGGAIKSELRKYFTTRMWWGMALGILVSGALLAWAFAWMVTSGGGGEGAPQGDATETANTVYTGGLNVGYLLLLTIGIMQIGSEYRHKTITTTLLSTPQRLVAMLAKVLALVVIAVLNGLVYLAGSVGVGALYLSSKGSDPFPSTEVYRTLGLSLLVLALWALIGLGIGILIPNQVAAILIAVGVAWIVEPLVAVVVGNTWAWGAKHVVPYFPSKVTDSVVAGMSRAGETRLDWWQGALVLAAYAAVLAGLGIWRTLRRDVT